MKILYTKIKTLLTLAIGFFAAVGILSLTQGHSVQAEAADVSLTAQVAALKAQVAALQAKTAPLSVSKTDLTITGVNVHIVSGSGSTSDHLMNDAGVPEPGHSLTGLGNLILGYNETGGNKYVRTGSHNLILGGHNSYSSFGGLVVGMFNTISGPYATISGGTNSTASGEHSSVTGGIDNTASGPFTWVGSGDGNTASEGYASVCGGTDNTASGENSVVSGGQKNIASGKHAVVSGGSHLIQKAEDGWTGGKYQSP